MKKLFITFLIGMLFSGCQVMKKKRHYENQSKNQEKLECQSLWKFEQLPSKTTIEVIYFKESLKHSISFYPNFVIGINNKSDTIAIIDNTYPCPQAITIGSSLNIYKRQWNSIEKETITLMGYTDVDKKILCSISTVYYAKIEWTN